MDSIIFDLDGTLWDSSDAVVASWNEILHADEAITTADLKRTMGLPFEEVCERLAPRSDKGMQERLLQVENEYLIKHGGNLYDNVEEVLKTLSQKYKLFIVSNCQEGYIEAFYAYHKLERYFVDDENPGRTGLSKGENIKLIIERNHLTSPVYVGDTSGDQKAAEQAGIPFIYASYGFGEVKDCDRSIHRFDELLKMF